MIEIKKGSQVLVVSKGAYNDTFKKLGYEIVNSKEEAKKASSNENKKNDDKELIKEEKEHNKDKQEADVVLSDTLNVNVIGENIKDFDVDKKEKSPLEKVLEDKSNKSKRK